MAIIHEHLIFLGAYFAFIVGIGQLLQKNKQPAAYIYGTSFITMGVWIFHICSYSTGIFQNYYIINLLLIPFGFISAPAMGLRYRLLLGQTSINRNSIIFYSLPALISLIIISYPLLDRSIIIRPEFLKSIPLFSKDFMFLPLYFRIIQILYFLPKLYLVILMYIVLKRMYNVIWVSKKTPQTIVLRAGYIFALNIFLSTAITGLGDLICTDLIKWSLLYVNGTFISVFLFGQRNPDYSKVIKTEIIKKHYEKSKITSLDVDAIIMELKTIMETEKAFASEDVSLSLIADELGITPHQLSEIINKNLHKNFNSFINEYRIKEAQKMLIEEPERTITSIAIAVGFNTNTAFSTIFSRSTGLSPKEYRRKHSTKK